MFGSTFAEIMTSKGKSVMIIDKRNHVAGNCYTSNFEGIQVHEYGCHVFHSNKDEVWRYVNKFAKFKNYTHRVKVNYYGKIYSFPINLFTMNQIWGISTPDEASEKINYSKAKYETNIEDYCVSLFGEELYEIFVKNYSKKQWGVCPKLLPSSIVKRIPVRTTFDDNYYSTSKYEGIPCGGYTKMVQNMLSDVKIEFGLDFFSIKNKWKKFAKRLVYCGEIDKMFDYEFGMLGYRSLRWEKEEKNIPNFQGCAVVNYTDPINKFTRIIEHKHLEENKSKKTIISYEYPEDYNSTKEPFYPINDAQNNEMYRKYRNLANSQKDITISGRLGCYKYIDMDDVIQMAINCTRKDIK